MQAGLRWRADVFLFLKWVWFSRFYRRVDSGDTPSPVRVLRSLERSGPSAAAKLPRLAPLTLDRRQSRLGDHRFSGKTGKGSPAALSHQASGALALFPHVARRRRRLGGTRAVLLRRHLRSCRCLPAGCGAGCVRHRRRRPRPDAILLGLGSARAVVLLRRLLLCGRHAGAHEQRHARQHGQILPHDTFLFFPVLPKLSVVRQPPAEMLVPAAKAQAAIIGGSHRRWRDAVCYCAGDTRGAAELKRTHPRVWPKRYGGRKNPGSGDIICSRRSAITTTGRVLNDART